MLRWEEDALIIKFNVEIKYAFTSFTYMSHMGQVNAWERSSSFAQIKAAQRNSYMIIILFEKADEKHKCTVNVDCVKFEYVALAKYHHMLIFEFDLLTKQHILILCKKLL